MLSRSKYIDEVLNEDRRIYHQVFDREKEQARVFNETVAPKGERDISAEVKTDSEIDRLKTLLDNKIVIGESITAPRITGKEAKGKDLERFNIGIGEITRTFNDIVRNAIRPDVKSETREMVKTKLQELSSVINTLVYLVPEVMLDVIKNPPVEGPIQARLSFDKMKAVIPTLGSLLNQYGVYASISKQLMRNSFKAIDNYDIQSSINNFINTRSPTTALYPAGGSDEEKLAYLLRAYVAGLSGVRYVDSDKLFENRRRLLEQELDRPLSKSEIDRIKLGFRGSPGASTGSPTSGGPAGTAVIPTTASAAAVGAEESKEEEGPPSSLGLPKLPLISSFANVFDVPIDQLREMDIADNITQTLTRMQTETKAFVEKYGARTNKDKPPASELDKLKNEVENYNNILQESPLVVDLDKRNSASDTMRILNGIDKINKYKITRGGKVEVDLHNSIKSLGSNYNSFYKRVFNKYISPLKMNEATSTEEETEGAGKPKRGRFSYRLGKILDYDDDRNEMYDY